MADLRALFVAVGNEDVATYVQGGNVIFKSPVDKPADLISTIEKRISRDHGLSVKVLLRTRAQLAKVRAGNPFAKSGKDPAKLHVTFLADTPDRARVRGLDTRRGEPDEFRVVGREIYLYCPDGYGTSKLTNAYFEKQLGVTATTVTGRPLQRCCSSTHSICPSTSSSRACRRTAGRRTPLRR